MSLALGLDVGTQGTKGLLLDGDSGDVLARAGRAYGLVEGLPPGAAEQHPQTWLDAVQAVLGELLASAACDRTRLVGLGVSGQQHGLVVLDEHDSVVRPAKLWCDTATSTEARELSAELGRPVPVGFTASKVRWLARHEPQHWARVRRVLLPHDYVNLALTGEATMEAGDASGTGFFDPEARCFDESAMGTIDPALPGMLPPLLSPGAPAGQVSAAAAHQFGLPEGLLVAAGGGDNMMSAVGSGATAPGTVVLSLGTSGTAFSWSDRPLHDPAGLIANFCDSTGGWLPLLCVMNATGVLEEVRAGYPEHDLDSLTAAAASVPPGCEGLLLLPYLQGERVPDLPLASAALTGWRPGTLRPGHLFRAALEGTSLNLARGVERLVELGVQPRAVHLVGGGAANALWRQILADVLAVPVRRLEESESAALGAAVCGLWTHRRSAGEDVSAHEVSKPFVRLHDEVIEPDGGRVTVYAAARERLAELTERLFG
jgi:xylulokinase